MARLIDCFSILMVGHNMSATQTVLWSRILDRLEAPQPPRLVVIDPRSTTVAQHADVHLAPKAGTNLAILNGILHLLFEHPTAIDHAFVQKHTIGVDRLRETVSHYTPEHVEELTGVPAETLQEAAMVIGDCQRLLSTALQGVYQSNQATAAACQINSTCIHI
jgi:ferredoxin-nitrate reductase